MGEHQVAARGERVHQPGHDLPRILGVRDQVQDDQHHQRDRLAQVQGAASGFEYDVRFAQIRVEVGGGALRGAAEQGAGVGEHDGVVVHIDDA